MKRILGIVGSPRIDGNTHILVQRILDGAEEAGAHVDLMLLKGLTIRECDGCHACWKGKNCCKNDDMTEVYPRLADSDVLVFGTPVYWYGPTALMKAFLDRFVYFNTPENRRRIAGHGAVLAIPFEETNPDTAALTVAMFEKSFEYLQMPLLGKVLAPGVGERGEMLSKADILSEAHQLGKRLALN